MLVPQGSESYTFYFPLPENGCLTYFVDKTIPVVTPLWSEVACEWVCNLYQCHYAINFIKLLPFSHDTVFKTCLYCYRYIKTVAFNYSIVFQGVNLLLLSFHCTGNRYLGCLLLPPTTIKAVKNILCNYRPRTGSTALQYISII